VVTNLTGWCEYINKENVFKSLTYKSINCRKGRGGATAEGGALHRQKRAAVGGKPAGL